MNDASLTQRAWTYIVDSLRLFYWILFKPFTLERRLRGIHPEPQNLNEILSEFSPHPRLHRYTKNFLQLIIVISLLFSLISHTAYFAITGIFLNILNSTLFLLGWLGGMGVSWLFWRFAEQRRRLLRFFIPTILIAALVVLFLINYMSALVTTVLKAGILFTGVIAGGITFAIALVIARIVSKYLPGAMVAGAAIAITSGAAIGVGEVIPGGMTRGIMRWISSEILPFIAIDIAIEPEVLITIEIALMFFSGVTGGFVLGIGTGITKGINTYVILAIITGVAGGMTIGIPAETTKAIAFVIPFIFGVLRFYFWLPELLWMGVLTLLTRPAQRAQRLRYLPPYFDELIYLPLPFVDRWIVDAYQTDPGAARQMVDYLINSTNQQKVAAQAMVGIAVDRLERCERLSDIVAITNELDWIPSPPPPAAGPALIKFLEISRDVRAATQATTPYREHQLLEPPLKSLQNLRNQLAFEQNARLATTYSRIIEGWVRILETARRTLEERARETSEIPQAYVAGPALDPIRAASRFKGRIDLFREIETFALQPLPPILLLRGGRRTGKSSTLNYLPSRVGSQIVPLVVDVQGIADATTLTGLAESMARQMIDMAHSAHNLTLPEPDARGLEKDPFPALRKWMRNVEKTVEDKRLLLCLDEFERLEEVIRETGSRAPLNFLRHLMQHRHQWILLFSSSHALDELAPYWSDYLINTRNLHISYLDEADARQLITQPVKDFPDIYQPATVDAIIHLTRCQPYFVQLVCSTIVEQLNRHKRRSATPQDVQTIIPRALATADSYFNEFWTNILTNQERLLLEHLVQGEQPHACEQETLAGLLRKEVLERKNDSYHFQVPLVEAFVKGKSAKL